MIPSSRFELPFCFPIERNEEVFVGRHSSHGRRNTRDSHGNRTTFGMDLIRPLQSWKDLAFRLTACWSRSIKHARPEHSNQLGLLAEQQVSVDSRPCSFAVRRRNRGILPPELIYRTQPEVPRLKI